jgi:hypothetical protein
MLSTVSGLAQVLAFANAVGSFEGLLQAACSQLRNLKVVVQLPEQVLELPLASCAYCFHDRQLSQFSLSATGTVGNPLVSPEQCSVLKQQVAKQLSPLLHLAHLLHLQPLLDVLHQFIMPNTWVGHEGVLSGVGGLVFTDAVLEAALGSGTLSKEAYISSVLSQPCSLTPGAVGHSSVLKPVGPKTYDAQTEMLRFDAQLLRDFAGGRAGDTVQVTLDLFGYDSIGGVVGFQNANGSSLTAMPVQLLLGQSFTDAAALQGWLKPAAAE